MSEVRMAKKCKTSKKDIYFQDHVMQSQYQSLRKKCIPKMKAVREIIKRFKEYDG